MTLGSLPCFEQGWFTVACSLTQMFALRETVDVARDQEVRPHAEFLQEMPDFAAHLTALYVESELTPVTLGRKSGLRDHPGRESLCHRRPTHGHSSRIIWT
jgi:hypothetical protein